MSFESIRLLPFFLVLSLVTILGACSNPEEATSPNDSSLPGTNVLPEGVGDIVEAE